MTLDALSDLNYGAVFVAALAYFVVGAIWYMAFGKQWQRGLGITVEGNPNPIIFVFTYVGYLVMVLGLAYIGLYAGVDTAGEGIGLGLLGALALVTPVLVVNGMYQRKAWIVTWIDTGNAVIGLSVAGLILGIWT
jgi:hypothetical protein